MKNINAKVHNMEHLDILIEPKGWLKPTTNLPPSKMGPTQLPTNTNSVHIYTNLTHDYLNHGSLNQNQLDTNSQESLTWSLVL